MSQPFRSGVETVELHVCPSSSGTVQVVFLHTAQDCCSGSTPGAEALRLGNILDALLHSVDFTALMYICTHHHLPPTCLQAAGFLSYTLETRIPYINSTNLHLLDYAPVARPQTSSTQSSIGRRLLSASVKDHVQFLEPPEGSVIGGAALAAAHRAAVARLLDRNGALAEPAPALEVGFCASTAVQWQNWQCCPRCHALFHSLASLQIQW